MIASTRYFGEAAYRREKAICDYRELRRAFDRPSYFDKFPIPTTFPKAELGICCPDIKAWWHPYLKHIIHNLP